MADSALDAIERFIAEQSVDTSKQSWRLELAKPPQAAFDPEHRYFWDMQTSVGPVVVRLMPEAAPMHVTSTLYLTKLGFYDGLTFHRIISQFMAQGGCPRGTGTGGPGYQYEGEFDPQVKHDRPGLLSMANAGPGTDGSQFFLTFVPAPWLDGKHTIFGEVVEGMDAVQALERRGSQSGEPSERLLIERAAVRGE